MAEVSGRENIIMDRRSFILLTGGALTASLWEWMTADPVAAGQIINARRIGETGVAHVEQRVRQRRHDDDLDGGGGQLLMEAAASLSTVTALLKERSYSDAHGARLHAAAADLARMKAWARFDVDEECDDATFLAALHSAHISSNPVLGSHILAFWSIAAYNSGRPADAETMTDAALSASRRRSTPRVEAMLLSRRARAHQGNQHCFNDLDRATTLHVQTGDTRDDPEWVSWFDQSELLGALASSHLDMDQPPRAETAFRQTAELFPTDRIRTHALFLARQGACNWERLVLSHRFLLGFGRSVGSRREGPVSRSAGA
ncbi:hypothetical protein [Streptomyces sp. NPDC059003]|uniref:hypothetical protein n=1 Tax=Streptomyces sp. NPDC059003 TaxID=3346691 RepID=UPI00369D31EF